MIKPKKLKKGDKIAIIAPSSPCHDDISIQKAIKGVVSLGFKVEVGPNVYRKNGYLTGSDEERGEELNTFFARNDIDGIICLRGGYGCMSMLNKINYDIVRNNPKVFAGMSDITAIHSAINKHCNLVTFLSPVAINFAEPDNDFTISSFIDAVMNPSPIGELRNPCDYGNIKILCPGEASGEFIGGNLTLLTSAIGTSYEFDSSGRIIFIEALDEDPARIDRMLMQLILSGKFHQCKGIVLGNWKGCEPKNKDRSFPLLEIFRNRLSCLGVPVFYNLACGHEKMKITIPLGVKARLTLEGRILIEEASVV